MTESMCSVFADFSLSLRRKHPALLKCHCQIILYIYYIYIFQDNNQQILEVPIDTLLKLTNLLVASEHFVPQA